MKVLFLAPYPFGRVASQRFRFEQYWDVLEAKHEIEFQSFLSESSFNFLYQKGQLFKKLSGVLFGFLRRSIILFSFKKFDYIFIHREASPIGPPVFEWILAKILRKKIIYDFDDAIWLPNTSGENKLAAFAKCHWKVKFICSWAERVTCGNDFLCDFAKKYNKNVVYLPTTLDLGKIPAFEKRKRDKKIIGWTGTHSTLKYLNPLIPVLQQLQDHFDFQFVVIADKDPRLPLKYYKFIKWVKESEWEDLSGIDIGLMPLGNSEWEEGKCGFKALQYMSLGIPAIASPTGANRKIITDGLNGFICADDKEWNSSLSKLLSDPNLPEQYSMRGAMVVEENFSKDAWKSKYLSLIDNQ